MKTPITDKGLRMYDSLPWHEAALRAWKIPGKNRSWHWLQQEYVRKSMPLLARALDRGSK
jgi:hypothetical protein